jgi:hypothetical protein
MKQDRQQHGVSPFPFEGWADRLAASVHAEPLDRGNRPMKTSPKRSKTPQSSASTAGEISLAKNRRRLLPFEYRTGL